MNKENLKDAYQGKNVYITGITGFKGSWLALMLHNLGANVRGIGLETDDDDCLFYSGRVQELVQVDIANMLDPLPHSALVRGILEHQPDFIFHLAAQPIVSVGYKDPFNTFYTNIMGTVMLHEILRGYECGEISVINITTDKVYKESSGKLSENNELRGYDPYSLSKSCSDMISTCYRQVYGGHKISTARAGNVIGGGDYAENRIVPDIVRSTKNKELLEIRNPHSIRPYQHVFDALVGYLVLAAAQNEHPELQGEWNVGPDESQTMKTGELVDKMQSYMNFDWANTGKQIGHESDVLILDNTKLKSIGWVPAFPTNDDVLKSTADWYNKHMNGDDMQKVTLEQIEEAFESYGSSN